MKTIAVIPPGQDEPVVFRSKNGDKTIRHILVAWKFADSGDFEPVLLPPPSADAVLHYEVGLSNPIGYLWKR